MSRCKCSHSVDEFCVKNIKDFMNCKNLDKVLLIFPALEMIVHKNPRKEYYIETDIIFTDSYEEQKHTFRVYAGMLINFAINVPIPLRYPIAVAIYDAIFAKNGKMLVESQTAINSFYRKLCELSLDGNHDAFNSSYNIYTIIHGERVVPQNIFECFKQSLSVVIENNT